MTEMLNARDGQITEAMKAVAKAEGLSPEGVCKNLAEGTLVITRNRNHSSIDPLAIGKGCRTKVNANIGTSRDHVDIQEELDKLKISLQVGVDTIMDLSTGGPIDEIRREILRASPVPLGTVPIYQVVAEAAEKHKKSFLEIGPDEIFSVIEQQAEDGVDFITVHCGVTRGSVQRLEKEGRVLGIVSRGGALLAHWMKHNKKENPLYEQYDRLLEIARSFDMVLSLGDGLRPGCLADATDRGQIQELIILGELTRRAWEKGVQVMIEGPGHVPADQIYTNIQIQKQLCHGAPFYVLGPLVTDIAPGYDHITAAIGGCMAATYGADFLCYVTPSEHLRLPTVEDVREGVVALKIAAHAADIAKGIPGSRKQDDAMAQCRSRLDWEGQIRCSMDPERAREIRGKSHPSDEQVCTMCADYCAIKMYQQKEGEQ